MHSLDLNLSKYNIFVDRFLGTGPNVTVVDTPGFKDTEDAEFVDELMNVLGDEVIDCFFHWFQTPVNYILCHWYLKQLIYYSFTILLGQRSWFILDCIQVQRQIYSSIQTNAYDVNQDVRKFLDKCCNCSKLLVLQKGKL